VLQEWYNTHAVPAARQSLPAHTDAKKNTSSLATSSLPCGIVMYGLLMHEQFCVVRTVAYICGIAGLRTNNKNLTHSIPAKSCQFNKSSTTQHEHTTGKSRHTPLSRFS
jgi:hypothetical protein